MPHTLKTLAMLALAAALVANLTACGRKGDLRAPGAYEDQKTPDGKPAPKPVEDKRFILDPLL